MTTQEYLSNMTEDMELRGLSERTMKVYTGAVSLFLKCLTFSLILVV